MPLDVLMPVARCCLLLSLGSLFVSLVLASLVLVCFAFAACSLTGVAVSSAVAGEAA